MDDVQVPTYVLEGLDEPGNADDLKSLASRRGNSKAARCVGVKAVVDGREQEFRAREIILSSGAIHSPAHLLRAGIEVSMTTEPATRRREDNPINVMPEPLDARCSS